MSPLTPAWLARSERADQAGVNTAHGQGFSGRLAAQLPQFAVEGLNLSHGHSGHWQAENNACHQDGWSHQAQHGRVSRDSSSLPGDVTVVRGHLQVHACDGGADDHRIGSQGEGLFGCLR